VIGVALLLVFGIGKLLGGTGEDTPSAATTASNDAPRQQTTGGRVTLGPVAPSATRHAKAKTPLPPPTGDCVADDVSVQPSVPRAWVGTPVVIELQLQGTELACTFEVSPESMVVKIVSGKDRIWSSQDCPKAIPTTSVVVRSGQPVAVPVTWSGRRSDEKCTGSPSWVLPGFYHVYAAALGSTPADVQFRVTRAAPQTVTRTPRPHPSAPAGAKSSTSPSTKTRKQPAATPSATVSGKQSKCGGDNAAGTC